MSTNAVQSNTCNGVTREDFERLLRVSINAVQSNTCNPPSASIASTNAVQSNTCNPPSASIASTNAVQSNTCNDEGLPVDVEGPLGVNQCCAEQYLQPRKPLWSDDTIAAVSTNAVQSNTCNNFRRQTWGHYGNVSIKAVQSENCNHHRKRPINDAQERFHTTLCRATPATGARCDERSARPNRRV